VFRKVGWAPLPSLSAKNCARVSTIRSRLDCSDQAKGSGDIPEFWELNLKSTIPVAAAIAPDTSRAAGSEGGYPILTFTTARTDILPNPNAPSEEYAKIIASGIKETYPQMSDGEIVDYLSLADGIRDQVDLPKVRSWVAAA